MDVLVTVERKSFKGGDGREIEYFDCVGEVGGQSVRFKIDPRDKSLFEFLFNQTL